MKRINNNNLDVYYFLKDFIRENGYAPSYRDIINGTNYKSPASIKVVIEKLLDLGFIKADTDIRGNLISRSIRIIEDKNTKEQIDELRKEYE